MKKVICIVGPTASGKTSLSINLAKEINGEIISCDSMQVYRDLNIGTAKVTKEEMQNIPHHLIDVCDIDKTFSAYDYKKLCYEKIEEIISRNKIPIIIGGTGLYMSAVIKDMDFKDEEIDFKYREELENIAKTKGNIYLHNMLKEVDKISANEIHYNNVKRVIRALEMYKLNNTKSKHMEKEKNKEKNNKYDFKLFCIDIDKEMLFSNINKRVDQMISQGLEKEAKLVYTMGNQTCKQAIGYKEFFGYFEKNKTIEEVIEEIKLRTRQYTKRQLTWFKKMDNIKYIKNIDDIKVNI